MKRMILALLLTVGLSTAILADDSDEKLPAGGKAKQTGVTDDGTNPEWTVVRSNYRYYYYRYNYRRYRFNGPIAKRIRARRGFSG